MRHEIALDGFIITSDNSAAIGEKPQDVVHVSDAFTAKFAARVALLEQWAAGSVPQAVLIHNFSGASSWEAYVDGVTELFSEANLALPEISGSSETNMTTQQSGIAVTMIGKQQRTQLPASALQWFVYGVPLVGEAVVTKKYQLANLGAIQQALDESLIERIWPVGSKGIAQEYQLVFGQSVKLSSTLDLSCSGGPATSVLIGVLPEKSEHVQRFFGELLSAIEIM